LLSVIDILGELLTSPTDHWTLVDHRSVLGWWRNADAAINRNAVGSRKQISLAAAETSDNFYDCAEQGQQ